MVAETCFYGKNDMSMILSSWSFGALSLGWITPVHCISYPIYMLGDCNRTESECGSFVVTTKVLARTYDMLKAVCLDLLRHPPSSHLNLDYSRILGN